MTVTVSFNLTELGLTWTSLVAHQWLVSRT